ncbi:MAG: hypothetical protein H6732_19660 [Alphaproteobacteria bacterium]|nr:hypothetical protein [Alphaproteobacteria bacterium]
MEYVTLRFVHLVFGILWAAGGIIMGWWVLPAVKAAGPAGAPVAQGIMARKFPQLMGLSALLAVLSGLRLYQLKFSTAWVASGEGVVLTLGMIVGLSAFGIAMGVQRPRAARLAALGAEVAAQGGPPTEAQAAELGALRERMGKAGNAIAWHLATVVVLMAGYRMAAVLTM